MSQHWDVYMLPKHLRGKMIFESMNNIYISLESMFKQYLSYPKLEMY